MRLTEVLKFVFEVQALAIPAGAVAFVLILKLRRPFQILMVKGIDKAIDAKSDDDADSDSSLPLAA